MSHGLILFDNGQRGLLAVACLASLAVAALLAWSLRRIYSARAGSRFCRPNELFDALCQAHRLDRSSRRLLRHLARALDLKHPGLLFVEPQRFELEQVPETLRRHETRLSDLRKRLFGDAAQRGRAAPANL